MQASTYPSFGYTCQLLSVVLCSNSIAEAYEFLSRIGTMVGQEWLGESHMSSACMADAFGQSIGISQGLLTLLLCSVLFLSSIRDVGVHSMKGQAWRILSYKNQLSQRNWSS